MIGRRAGVAWLCAGFWMGARATDRITNPPARRERLSPAGRYRLVVEAADDGRGERTRLSLLDAASPALTVLWSQPIPQGFGPREMLVNDRGQVLLVDEGINVRSSRALMLFDRTGHVVATMAFESLVRVSGATEADIRQHARRGTWMGDPVTLDRDGDSATIPFAGRLLRLQLSDGSLSLRP